MITIDMAEKEIAFGLSAVCAWCEHWHDAKMRGENVKCGLLCGGPSSGMAFPLYKGPMAGRLGSICFICGKEADAGLSFGGGFIGVCERIGPNRETHLDKFKVMISGPGKRVVANEIVVPVVEDKV
jgi:hypothetical protein